MREECPAKPSRTPIAPVLVVDGEADFRDTLLTVLQREGYAVRWSENLTEALALLNSSAFSLVIVDLFNPYQGRLSLVKAIIEAARRARVVILTNEEQQTLLQRFRAMGAFACLVKPVKREIILEVVKRALPPQTKSVRSQ